MSTEQDIFENKHERNDFIIALIVIAVFSVFIYMLLKKGSSDEVLPNKDVLVKSTISNIDTTQVVIDHSSLNDQSSLSLYTKKDSVSTVATTNNLLPEKHANEQQNQVVKPIQNKSIITKQKINKTVSLESKTDSINNPNQPITNTNTIEAKAEIESKINDNNKTTANKIKEIKTEAIKEETPQATTELNDEINSEITNSKQANTNSTLEDCVIVVGVYRDEVNLNKTLKKLEDNGFTFTSGQLTTNGLYYAGSPIQCNASTLKAKMNRLNTIFNIESWLHKK
jgi:FtsZ-interacting cell division protein ZipA